MLKFMNNELLAGGTLCEHEKSFWFVDHGII
jgi:hypothetical protein